MKWQRTVTYEIEADTLAEAEDVWGEDGPEIATAGGVVELDSSDLTPVEEKP